MKRPTIGNPREATRIHDDCHGELQIEVPNVSRPGSGVPGECHFCGLTLRMSRTQPGASAGRLHSQVRAPDARLCNPNHRFAIGLKKLTHTAATCIAANMRNSDPRPTARRGLPNWTHLTTPTTESAIMTKVETTSIAV